MLNHVLHHLSVGIKNHRMSLRINRTPNNLILWYIATVYIILISKYHSSVPATSSRGFIVTERDSSQCDHGIDQTGYSCWVQHGGHWGTAARQRVRECRWQWGGNVQRIGFHYEVGGEEILKKRKGQRPQPLHAFLVPLCFHFQRD